MERRETIELREIIERFKRETGRTNQEIAEGAGISRPAVSQYMNGNYASGVEHIEEKLEAYLDRMYGFPVRQRSEGAVTKPGGLIMTADACDITAVCEDCRRFHEIGIITGRPGRGKTYTLRYYARMKKVVYLECDATMGKRDLVEAISEQLGLSTQGTVHRMARRIWETFGKQKGWLLIVDEADKLLQRNSADKLEILRGIYDHSEGGAGLVLAGEPKLETDIARMLERLESRASSIIRLQGLTGEEVERYLEGCDVEAAALDLLKERATNGRRGSFRVLDRTMGNLVRLMNERGETRISAALVREVLHTSAV